MLADNDARELWDYITALNSMKGAEYWSPPSANRQKFRRHQPNLDPKRKRAYGVPLLHCYH
jgi:hypothetical protein